MFNFILKLQQQTLWSFGNVSWYAAAAALCTAASPRGNRLHGLTARSVKFCMDQLFVPNDSSKEKNGLCASVGMSALLLVCRNKARSCAEPRRRRRCRRSQLPPPRHSPQRFDLLCPDGCLEFVSASVQQAAGRDYALEEYFPVDSDIDPTFHLPSLPGKKAPPIESVMLLARCSRLR